MSNKRDILEALTNLDLYDDCLSLASGVKPGQTVYTQCRSLAEAAIVCRQRGICNKCHRKKQLTDYLPLLQLKFFFDTEESAPTLNQSWYWEGNVQSKVVTHLALNGFSIRSVADTSTKVAGKDYCRFS
ncbi:hypothetical protein NST84_03200 [Paenibacillus sp. FSL R7-0345]|uniref:hypothetical protein n=1 Tax=Paenibacillus sp. FSL R7-0345 TaxID=2954535 RepID=UPI00315A6FD4